MTRALMVVALVLATVGAHASGLCIASAGPKGAIIEHNGSWITLTPEQWEFLRGIYALHPDTPAGLPYGDKAVLAQVPGDTGGLIFFIDGDQACTPMPVPAELLKMLNQIGGREINHEGQPN